MENLALAVGDGPDREAAPPGLPWLADIVNNYIDLQSQIFLAVLGLRVLVGSFSGWFLRRLTPDLSN